MTSFLPLAAADRLAALGAILFGLATPSEAAAIGSLGALLLALFYGADYTSAWRRVALLVYVAGFIATVLYLQAVRFDLTAYSNGPMIAFMVLTAVVALLFIPANSFGLGKLKELIFLTGCTTAMVCWLFIGSSLFAAVFARLGAQQQLESWILGLARPVMGFLWLTMLIIFLLGWPLEWTEIIVIFVPIFLPMLKTFHIDPLLFGVMIAVNLQTAFLSPPVAMSAFYLKGVAPAWVNINDIFRGVLPYMLIVIICDGACSTPSRRSACGCRTISTDR